MAQPFDPGELLLSGTPIQVQGNINAWPARAKADFSVSDNGVLVYSAGMSGRGMDFFWTTADGTETPILRTNVFTIPALSPDATRIAFDVIDEQAGSTIIWVYDILSKAKMRLTFAEQGVGRPVWSRDGSRVYYNMEVGGSKANIASKRSDGSGDEEVLVRGEPGESIGYYPSDVSPDGRFLLLELSNESRNELAVVDLKDSQKPPSVRKIGIRGKQGRFSPDGHWIVYESNESGSERVYVSSFAGRAGKWQLSPEGGAGPYWLKDRVVYYSALLNRHESLDVTLSSGTPVFGKPEPLFPPGKSQNTFIGGSTKDGKRFLGYRPVSGGSKGYLSIVVNWQGLLESK
jgi:hypothetical protein